MIIMMMMIDRECEFFLVSRMKDGGRTISEKNEWLSDEAG